MYSKNNVKMKAEKKAVKSPKYGLAKLSVGVASVLLGTTLVYGANAQADTKTMVQPTPATEGALASSAAPASSAAQSATVTSEDVQKASDAASAAQATADAHKQAVSDAQTALDKAKAANSDAAAVKDALNNAKSAEAAESAAFNASVSAYNEQTAADQAVNDAKTAAYTGWQKDYNNFLAEAKTNNQKLADAKKAQDAAQKQVDELSAAVKGQEAVISQQTEAKADALDDLHALKGAKVTSGAKFDAAVAKLKAAQTAIDDATAKKADYDASLAAWTKKLKGAKKATETAQAAVDYDNGLYKLNDHDAKIMAAKKAADDLPTLELKAKAAKAAHDAKFAQYQAAQEATKAAKAAYNQAKLDHNLPSADQLANLENKKAETSTAADAAEKALDNAAAEAGVTSASTAIDILTKGMKNDDKAIAANQAAVDDLQAQLDAANKDLAAAEAILATDKDDSKASIDKDSATAKIEVLKAQLRQAKLTLKTSQNVKERHQGQLEQKQDDLATAKAKPAYVKALNDYNTKKKAADEAAAKLKAAKDNLDATKDARMNLNDAQNKYDAAVQKQAELDKAAADAKAAYEELYAKLNNGEKPADNTNPGKDDQGKGETTNPGTDDQGKGETTNPGTDDQSKGDNNTTKDNGSDDASKNAGNKTDGKDDASKGASDVMLKGANGKTAQVKLAATKAATKAVAKDALPQTGNESAVAATGLGVAALVGMLGLAGASKRRA